MPEPKVFHTLSDHCVGEKCLMTKYAFVGNFFGEFHNQWLSSVVLINMKQSHFRQFFLLCLLLLRTALVLFLSSVQPSQKDLGSGPNGSGSSAPEKKAIFTMSKASLGTGDRAHCCAIFFSFLVYRGSPPPTRFHLVEQLTTGDATKTD